LGLRAFTKLIAAECSTIRSIRSSGTAHYKIY